LTPKLIGPNRAGSALVYGWKLHIVAVVAAVWFPIAAVLTPANIAVSRPAPALLREVPAEVRFVLGDRHYNTPDLYEVCERDDRLLVTTQYGRYPHTDEGVEVRRIFHKLRSRTNENFNEHFKGIFDGHGQVSTKGLLATQRFADGGPSWSTNWLYCSALSAIGPLCWSQSLSQSGLMMYDQAALPKRFESDNRWKPRRQSGRQLWLRSITYASKMVMFLCC
jgi:hypothetical protein